MIDKETLQAAQRSIPPEKFQVGLEIYKEMVAGRLSEDEAEKMVCMKIMNDHKSLEQLRYQPLPVTEEYREYRRLGNTPAGRKQKKKILESGGLRVRLEEIFDQRHSIWTDNEARREQAEKYLVHFRQMRLPLLPHLEEIVRQHNQHKYTHPSRAPIARDHEEVQSAF